MTAARFKFGDHAAVNSSYYGDWRLPEIYSLDLKIVVDLLLEIVEFQEVVNFSDIAFKGIDKPLTSRRENCACCDGKRYVNCDPSIPGILIKDGPNPFDLPYRMVDGKHRIERLIARGETESLFNVITYDTLKLELKPAVTQWEDQNRDSC